MAEHDALTLDAFYTRLQKVFYVYALCYSDGTPFYVGKGTDDRVGKHEAEAKDPAKNEPKHRIIRQIWDSGQQVYYRILGVFFDEIEAHEAEKRFIGQYGRKNNRTGILANLTAGGEGYIERYASEKWETDENGVRILQNVGTPSERDLAAPRLRCLNDAIWWEGLSEDGQRRVKGWKKPDEWTGPEMPLLAQWQGHGLTIQVFSEYAEKDLRAWLRSAHNTDENLDVVVRVFDGVRRILEDSSAFHPHGDFGACLRSHRPKHPSAARLKAERMLAASILHRLAEMAYEAGDRVRFDWRHGSKNLNKRQQAWLKYNSGGLRRIADSVDQ